MEYVATRFYLYPNTQRSVIRKITIEPAEFREGIKVIGNNRHALRHFQSCREPQRQ